MSNDNGNANCNIGMCGNANNSSKMCGNVVLAEGHRGYCARYPENTLVSFRNALKLGVDAVEFDVWLTSDKVPVIMHDGNTMRTTGVEGIIREMPLSEVKKLDAGALFAPEFAGERVPTLQETLEVLTSKPDLLLGVEIKEYTFETADITIQMLREFNCLDRAILYAFNARIIKYLKQKYNARTMAYPSVKMQEFEDDSYDYYDEIGISMSIFSRELCEQFDAMNKPLHIYCADNEADVNKALSVNPYMITANDPVPLLRILDERGLRKK